MEEKKVNLDAEVERIAIEQAVREVLEQEQPIVLDWSNRIVKGNKQEIAIYEEEGKRSYMATFLLSKIDMAILQEAAKQHTPMYFKFAGHHFEFEMAVNPKKILMDNGVLCLFGLDT